ncbi:MAG: hypothetical protein PHH04_00450 [Thomasclavelia sp.]|nr:hypothetical protein [Thomasclavelia sp.]
MKIKSAKNSVKEFLLKLAKRPETYIILVGIILRFILAYKVGFHYYSAQGYDDNLLASYAFPSHWTNPSINSLLKTMSFPLLLDLAYVLHIDYASLLCIIWVITALTVYKTCSYISNKRVLSIFAFLYTLYFPTAFESWMGTRLYRNAIIAPFTIILISILLLIFFKIKRNEYSNKGLICNGLLLGCVFSFSYYIKEDGLWMLAVLLFFIVCYLGYLTFNFFKKEKNRRKFIIFTISIFIPLMFFGTTTIAYKQVNKHFFGVAEVETRNGGELGKYVANVYKIESNNRDYKHWAPKDAIIKSFKASKTLSKYPKLLNSILHSSWYNGNIEKNPIEGDFYTWVLRSSLSETKIWKSEKQINDLFKKVNSELSEAFKSGELKKDNKIQLFSSAGGRTMKEIYTLFPIVRDSFEEAIALDSYAPGSIVGESLDKENTEATMRLTRTNYLMDYNYDGTLVNSEQANKVITYIFDIYSVLNPILFFLAIIMAIYQVLRLLVNFKNVKSNISKWSDSIIKMLMICVLFGVGIAYAFSISWFDQFLLNGTRQNNFYIQNFYTIALPGILLVIYMLGLDLLFENVKNIFSKFRNNENKTKSIE